jgi:Rap1a immunity proteins
MRYLVLACLLSGVLLASGPTPEQDVNLAVSGNDFLRVCDTQAASKTVFDGVCLGYVGGVLDGVDLAFGLGATARKEPVKSTFCLPAESTLGQKYHVVVKFIKDHPGKAHFPTDLLIFEAIVEAFPPCPQAAEKPPGK